MTQTHRKWALAAGFALIGLLSFFVFADSKMMTQLTAEVISSLDEKKAAVLSLATASTTASFAITAIPGDVGMPIAQNLADLSDYFILVFGAIWLQKYLIGITGFVTFKLLLPVVSFVLAANVFLQRGSLTLLAKKLFLFGLVFFAMIPTSLAISKHIESTQQESAEIAIQNVEKSQKELAEKNKKKNWLESFISSVGDLAGGAMKKFQVTMNNMTDAVAVLIITTCLIPVLVVLFFLWAVKLIFGLDFSPRLPRVSLVKRGQAKAASRKAARKTQAH